GINVTEFSQKRYPSQVALPLAKQRTHIGRHETGEAECILHPSLQRKLTDIVTVVEYDTAPPLELKHKVNMAGHALECKFLIRCRIIVPQVCRLSQTQAVGNVHVNRIMC